MGQHNYMEKKQLTLELESSESMGMTLWIDSFGKTSNTKESVLSVQETSGYMTESEVNLKEDTLTSR